MKAIDSMMSFADFCSSSPVRGADSASFPPLSTPSMTSSSVMSMFFTC